MKFSFFGIFARIGQVALLGTALFVTTDVILRYIFNSPMIFSIDVTGALLLLVAFMGLAYAERRGAHVSVNAFVRLMPEKAQSVLSQVTWVIEFIWALVICAAVIMLVKDFLETSTRSMSTEWLLYPFASIMIVGAIVLVFTIAVEARNPFSRLWRRKEINDTRESEENDR